MSLKYLRIVNAIRESIIDGTYPPGSFLPTEQQLCREYSVSRQTVRHALTQLCNEGAVVRRQGSGTRVAERELAQERRQRTVAVIVTYITNYIFPGVLRDIEAVFSLNDCSMLLFSTGNQVAQERQILQNLLSKRDLDGILVEGTKAALPNPNLDLYRQLQASGIPIIFFHGYYRELENSVYVLDNNFDGGCMLVDYLADKGHKYIAGIFKSDDIQGQQRYAGFMSQLIKRGLPISDANLCWYCTEDKQYMHSGSSFWTDRIMPALENCSAVVCYNDEVASALAQQLIREGISIPRELAVVSFDNSVYSELSTCRISSLSHGDKSVGTIAAQSLMARISGNTVSSRLVSWILMEKASS